MDTAMTSTGNNSATADVGTPDSDALTEPEAIAKPEPVRSVTINGVEYPLARFRLREMTEFATWANCQLPKPYDAIAGLLEAVCHEDRGALRALAYEDARQGPRGFGDPVVLSLAQTPTGVREVLYLSLRRADPSMTREQSDLLADDLAVDQVGMVVSAALRSED